MACRGGTATMRPHRTVPGLRDPIAFRHTAWVTQRAHLGPLSPCGRRPASYMENGMQDGERLKVLARSEERLADMRRYL